MTSLIKRGLYAGLAALISGPLLLGGAVAYAQASNDRDFALQVSPTPIVETIKPGVKKTIELKITNRGSQAEKLKAELRDFNIDQDSGDVRLKDTEPKDVRQWVTFADPVFSLERGQTFTEKIIVNPPTSVGFTYAFAIAIKQFAPPKPDTGKTAYQGSVAVFTLLKVDRPGAESNMQIIDFSSKKRVYEYLPAEFNLRLKNTGNILLRPAGNVFVQRSSKGQPISVLPANASGGYMLPGMIRNYTVLWDQGFPVFVDQKIADNINPKKRLSWDFSKLQQLRFGRYTAKAVVVYNDGQRDVPLMAEVSFWVIPWKILIGIIVVLALIIIGLISIFKNMAGFRRYKKQLKTKPVKQDSKKSKKSVGGENE